MGVKREPADIAFSNAVRESYDYTCAHCEQNYRHNPGYVDCSHIHSRKHRNTRWQGPLESGATGAIALCKPCHRRFTDFPLEWADFCRKHLGDTGYEESKRMAWETRKYTKAEKKEITEHYKAELDRIKFLRANGEQGYIRLIPYD